MVETPRAYAIDVPSFKWLVRERELLYLFPPCTISGDGVGASCPRREGRTASLSRNECDRCAISQLGLCVFSGDPEGLEHGAASTLHHERSTTMFYHDGGKLQYEVRVDTPNPVFAKALQQRSAASRARSASAFNREWGTCLNRLSLLRDPISDPQCGTRDIRLRLALRCRVVVLLNETGHVHLGVAFDAAAPDRQSAANRSARRTASCPARRDPCAVR